MTIDGVTVSCLGGWACVTAPCASSVDDESIRGNDYGRPTVVEDDVLLCCDQAYFGSR